MRLEGSCHCEAVRFSLDSFEPWPYQRCYCSICRKTGGSGGYMINLGGDARTLEVEGGENTRGYRARIEHDGKTIASGHCRYFCVRCGSHLYAIHDKWPDHVHPVSSAIDTPLPTAPATVHMMLGSKPEWVPVPSGADDETFDAYPELSLADWHKQHGYPD